MYNLNKTKNILYASISIILGVFIINWLFPDKNTNVENFGQRTKAISKKDILNFNSRMLELKGKYNKMINRSDNFSLVKQHPVNIYRLVDRHYCFQHQRLLKNIMGKKILVLVTC